MYMYRIRGESLSRKDNYCIDLLTSIYYSQCTKVKFFEWELVHILIRCERSLLLTVKNRKGKRRVC
jgi:hypothetical protein